MQFSLLDLTMNNTYGYELHPRHLINVATLPYESQNSENVILLWDIHLPKKIVSNVSHMIQRNGLADYKIWCVMQQCVYETMI